MSVSKTVAGQLDRASWIRRMFEEGARMRAERGADRVFDFTLGNPEVEPPPAVLAALRQAACDDRPNQHRYMPNAGFLAVREAIAASLRARTGLPYTPEHILMTCGAAGAMNVSLKAMLDPGDEVVVLVPYFPEYRFYIENHAGRVVPVETDAAFQPDLVGIAAAITPRTKALVLNSPNNPTGAVYPAPLLAELAALLARYPDLTVLSDEPYRALVFDGLDAPTAAAVIPRTIVCDSWSKTLAIAGERIGYLAISPGIPEWAALRDACTFANRVLGFVNASAIWQRVVAQAGQETIDVAPYQDKRDLFCDGLQSIGYHAPKPAGAFYIFPQTPIPDDLAFIRLLLNEGILAVPGAGFDRPGYMRLTLTVPRDTIERSLPAFARAFEAARVVSKP